VIFVTQSDERKKRGEQKDLKVYSFKHTVLALLVTDSQHRQRGAGSLLVQWGIEQSGATGLPCYLQASEQGRRLYEHYGFQEIDTVEYNLSDYGLEGVEKMTEMLREPGTKSAAEASI
jgi:predicted GNAT family N-acyltransferase